METNQTQVGKPTPPPAAPGSQAAKPPAKKHEAEAGAKAPTDPNAKPGEDKKPAAPRVRASARFPDAAKITLISEKNPKREGSKAHPRFALYKTGQTVGEFIKAGGTFGDLDWDSSHGFISVEGVTAKVLVKAAPKPKKEAPAAGTAPAAPATASEVKK